MLRMKELVAKLVWRMQYVTFGRSVRRKVVALLVLKCWKKDVVT